ncbi:LOW QUALITY PROTEIN: G patch domain-containing protein 1-like [Octopus sinensis]|uniref:LOW QUALITY PROTEIN: G patch domain-containing protein 1-like n=1 Tax=Octopus sinensis TaxID=2607531 RepID=A0A6P7TA00_9MOLL|nr:LOW QUALITY PROTEIN: G patch domain-containing protein 1-like [Octopus sinensis]
MYSAAASRRIFCQLKMQVAFTADCGVFLLLFESMADSDEDTDSYVVLGEAIGTVLPDEPLKRPLSVNELPVKDNQGRVRFHGAFTGGFSAGYFNSVGSKEGWAPTTFVSSRQNRNKKIVLTAEDFMDDDDFSEHGIAPRKIVTSDHFKSEEGATKRKNLANSLLSTNSFLHNVDGALLDFIVPEKISIGVKLLRKMGWKEGQGVGPRQRKRRKKELKSSNKKLYGCAAVPSDSDSEISDDNSLQHVEFAPKDMCRISFHVKDNLHGLGYSGINIKAALPSTHVSLFSEPSKYNKITGIKKNKRGIKGIAFGVGAMEEDDEDIYAADSLSKYDQSIGFADEEDNLHGWTAPGRNKPGPAPPNNYVGKILEGFTLSSKPLTLKVAYQPPQIPKGYRPYHTFEKLPLDIQQPSETLKPQNSILNALSRSIIIGETKTTGSVFDLISKSSLKNLPKFDSSKMSESVDEKTKCSNDDIIIIMIIIIKVSQTRKRHLVVTEKKQRRLKRIPLLLLKVHLRPVKLGMKPFKIQSSQPLQTSSALQSDFQPFLQDPLKQERYNKYLLLLKHGKVDPYSLVCDSNMTEWEHEIEKEEFSKAAKLFKPLAAAMASRFTKAKFQDDADSVELPEDVTAKKKDLSNAVEMKLYGKLTREIFDWHPDKLLCRRFNVPDPHPGSGIIGVPKAKHDKYSIFDFLAPPPVTEEKNRCQQDDPVKSSDNTAKNTSDKTTTSAPEKPSIFSHLMAEKPASTPSISDSPNKEPVITSTPQPTVEEGERPPMDLFKAIFADSSSDSEEEEEEEKPERKKEEHKEEEKKKKEEVNENEKNRAKETESKEKELKPTLPPETFQAPNLERKKENAESIKEKISPSHSSKDSDSTENEAASVEVYGPALPPKFTTKSPSSSNKQLDPLDKKLLGFLKKSSSKKHRHKSKHTSKKSEKDKHRQRKDKKQKKKKKKKKKHSSSRTYDSSSSSSSSAD